MIVLPSSGIVPRKNTRLWPRLERASLAFAALLLGAAALAQTDTVVLRRAAELRQDPSENSASLASLPVQTTLTRQNERQGAWVRVQTSAGQSGWLHMFDLGSPAPQSSLASSATGALRSLGSLFSHAGTAAPAPSGTSTVGIRGLQAQDIANAQPNLAALQQAESLRSDAAQARRFASEAHLSAQTVEPLPEPAPAPASTMGAEHKGNTP